jgi:hypothetical protein
MYSYGNGFRITNNTHYQDVIVQSTQTFSKRYNPKIELVRSWDFDRNTRLYPVIIDNMMNLERLFEATKLTGDSTYCNISLSHTEQTRLNHFRYDHSSYRVVDFVFFDGLINNFT